MSAFGCPADFSSFVSGGFPTSLEAVGVVGPWVSEKNHLGKAVERALVEYHSLLSGNQYVLPIKIYYNILY